MIITYSIHTVWLVITAVFTGGKSIFGKKHFICRHGMAIILNALIMTVFIIQTEEAYMHKIGPL